MKVTSPKSGLSLVQGVEGAGRDALSFAAFILEPGQAERRIPDYRFGFQMNFLFLEGRTTLVHRIPGDFQRLSRGQAKFLSASGRYLHQAAWRRGSLISPGP